MLPLSRHLARVSSFVGVLAHLLGVARRNARHHMLPVVATLDLLAAGVRGSIIALVVMFVRLAETGQLTFKQLTVTYNRQSFVVLACVLFVLLMFEAVAAFVSARIIVAIGRQTQAYLANTILARLHSIVTASTASLVLDPSRINHFLLRDARQASMAVMTMLRSFQPLVYTAVAFAALFVLEPVLTAYAAIVLVLLVPAVYLLSRRIQTDARQFFQARAQRLGQLLSGKLREFDAVNVGRLNRLPGNWLLSRTEYRDYLDSLDRNLMATGWMRLIVSVFRSVLIAVGVLMFGIIVLGEERPWATLVGFVVGMTFLMTGAQNLLNSVAVLNRLYPQIKSVIGFVSILEEKEPQVRAQDNVGRITIAHGSEAMEVEAGTITAFAATRAFRRHNYFDQTRMLRECSDAPEWFWNEPVLLMEIAPLTGMRLGEALRGALPPERSKELLGRALEDIAAAGESVALGPDSHLTSELWQQLQKATQCALLLLAALAGGRGPLFVSDAIIAALPPPLRASLRRYINDHYLFVVVTPPLSPSVDVSGWIIVHEGVLQYAGSSEDAYKENGRHLTPRQPHVVVDDVGIEEM